MTIEDEPSEEELEAASDILDNAVKQNSGEPTKCPICGVTIDISTGRYALSRRDNRTRICSDCGFDEAITDYMVR